MNDHPAPAWFVAGTDTEIGKTFITCALLHAFTAQGIRAAGMKPIAAGTDSEGHNEDVEQLLAAMPVKPARELVNPYLFAPAIAPHIAAAEVLREIEIGPIRAAFNTLQTQADAVLVEGVGGFLVPLGTHYDAADLACDLSLPVILVVGMRLGCINHALLTRDAIAARGLHIAGWVANCIDPAMNRLAENIETLKARLPAPLLGIVPPGSTPQSAAKLLTLPN